MSSEHSLALPRADPPCPPPASSSSQEATSQKTEPQLPPVTPPQPQPLPLPIMRPHATDQPHALQTHQVQSQPQPQQQQLESQHQPQHQPQPQLQPQPQPFQSSTTFQLQPRQPLPPVGPSVHSTPPANGAIPIGTLAPSSNPTQQTTSLLPQAQLHLPSLMPLGRTVASSLQHSPSSVSILNPPLSLTPAPGPAPSSVLPKPLAPQGAVCCPTIALRTSAQQLSGLQPPFPSPAAATCAAAVVPIHTTPQPPPPEAGNFPIVLIPAPTVSLPTAPLLLPASTQPRPRSPCTRTHVGTVCRCTFSLAGMRVDSRHCALRHLARRSPLRFADTLEMARQRHRSSKRGLGHAGHQRSDSNSTSAQQARCEF